MRDGTGSGGQQERRPALLLTTTPRTVDGRIIQTHLDICNPNPPQCQCYLYFQSMSTNGRNKSNPGWRTWKHKRVTLKFRGLGGTYTSSTWGLINLSIYCLACLLSHNCFALCLTYVCAQKSHLVFFKSVTMSFQNNSSDNAVKVNDKAQWTLHVFMSSTICSDDTKLATTLFCLFRTKKSPHDWKSQASQHAIKMHDETHHVSLTDRVAKAS